MNDPSPVARRPSRSTGTEPRGGTVLMEAVLCLPLLLFLVTGIVQFARIWEARLLVQYAAYNAARAALVYNPADYGDASVPGSFFFYEHRGPVWQAAANTMAWKSATMNRSDNLLFPGFAGANAVENSSGIWGSEGFEQVRVFPGRSWESNGMVCVTINFQLPLIFSIFDPSLPTPSERAPEGRDEEGEKDPLALLNDMKTLSLTESCILPKPWSTDLYPRLSLEEGQAVADFHSRHVVPDAPSLNGKDGAE